MDEEEYYSFAKRVFTKLAPFYNIVALPLAMLRNRVVAFTDARDGSRILDVATGTGKQAFAFAKRGYDVTGIDLSEAMLRVASRNNKYKNARFAVADATNLPFDDSTFDVSCVCFALHSVPCSLREKILGEMVRVTRSEGTIVLFDYAVPRNRVGRFLVYNLDKLWETKNYSEFIHSDFEELLRKCGIEVKQELRVLLKAARIMKAMSVNHLSL